MSTQGNSRTFEDLAGIRIELERRGAGAPLLVLCGEEKMSSMGCMPCSSRVPLSLSVTPVLLHSSVNLANSSHSTSQMVVRTVPSLQVCRTAHSAAGCDAATPLSAPFCVWAAVGRWPGDLLNQIRSAQLQPDNSYPEAK